MARLRRSDTSRPGISRRRRGRGFSYAHPDGRRVSDDDTLQRIRGLAVPPAWSDVWISPWPNGHIQAIGTDAAGRRQYRYHPQWRLERDRKKFERMQEFGNVLPKLRSRVRRDLKGDDLTRDRVLAAVVRLLDVGFFRIGGEEYALEHETFGVASLRKEHVHIHEGAMVFDYPAKDAIERTVTIRDAPACAVVEALHRRRTGGPNLFAFKQGRRWVQVHAHDINLYIKAVAGEDFSAKDFRTWSATVVAAAALAENETVPASRTGRRRAVVEAVGTVAEHLGNTPTVSRSSYIDPKVIDRFEDGETIRKTLGHEPDLEKLDALRGHSGGEARAVEKAVIDLLEEQ
jgi:DNA topoisomerase I